MKLLQNVKYYTVGWVLCIVLLLLTSCENFLDSKNVAQEIQDAIEIANSDPVTIYIEAEKDSGTVTPAQVKVKRNDSFDLKFSPSDDWKFIGWQVINRASGEPVENVVKFGDASKLETKATLLKPSDNLLICPKCLLLPDVVSVTPAGSEIAYANTPIVITFNMPMEETSVTANNSVFKFGDQNISIKYEQTDLSSYFDPPEFNADKTVLTIVPKIDLFTRYLQEELKLPVTKIQINFGEKVIISKEDINLSLRDMQTQPITVNYRQEAETQPPVEINESFFISKSEITPLNAAQLKNNAFHQDDISRQGTMSSETFKGKVFQNLTNGTFYISGTYYDGGSGVKNVSVRAINEEDGSEESFDFTEDSENATFITNNGYTTFYIQVSLTFKYQFSYRRIEVNILDACGNSSLTKTYYAAIKDLYLDDVVLYVFNYNGNEDCDPNLFKDSSIFDMEYYKETIKKPKIYHDEEQHVDRCIYENYHTSDSSVKVVYPPEKYTLEYEYIDKSGTLRREPVSAFNESEQCWSIDLDVESVNNLDVKLIASDGLGNTAESTVTFIPTKPLVLKKIESAGSNKVKITYDASYVSYSSDKYLIWKENDVYKYSSYGWGSNNYITLDEGKNYYLFNCEYYEASPLISEVYYNTQMQQTEVQRVSLSKAPEVEECADGYANITLTLPDNIWTENGYDSIYAYASVNGSKYEAKSFNKNETSLTYRIWSSNMLRGPTSIYVYAMKNGFLSTEKGYTIPKLTSLSYDSVKPKYQGVTDTDNFIDYTNCYYKDDESGMDYVEVYINNLLKYTFTQTDDEGKIAVKVPRIEVLEKDGANYYRRVAVDKAGNKTESTSKVYATPFYSLYFDSKNNLSWTFTTGEIEWPTWNGFTGTVFKFNTNTNEWLKQNSKSTSYDYNNTGNTYTYNLTYTVPENSFIKIITNQSYSYRNMNNYGVPRFYYTGTQNSGNYDLILPNGSEKDSIAISSDAPVYVSTMVTSKEYSKIQNWKKDTWEFRAKVVGEKQINFSTTDYSPKKYKIPVGLIDDGNCYCVIAHFADGTTAMSEVMQR